ncbi:MAG: hypothetical protein FJ077_07735 [Cyanobacteria bacterium K_DeepCast_35m_m2_023]|nr:hypothetical protein [Cyanobacteria bacterium K_DeepCast_35m_m2_023]
MPDLACSVSNAAVVLLLVLFCDSLAQPADLNVSDAVAKIENQGVQLTSPTLLQSSIVANPEPARSPSKIEAAATKKGQPSWYGAVTKPGFFTVLEQGSAWNFPGTGSAWGTGAGAGSTFLGFGVSGSIKGAYDNLLNWSVQLGPLFQHTYSVPGLDRTPLRMDVSAFLSPLRGDDLNIYAIWRGVAWTDGLNQRRFTNVVRSGILYSFAGSRIIPDSVELINLPESGFYVRIEPSWTFGLDGQLLQVTTQSYLGLSETYYPFTFAIEIVPQFVQTASRELQTNLGSFFDLGYLMSAKTRAFVRYRPAVSFGGNQYPAAGQIFQAGVAYRF